MSVLVIAEVGSTHDGSVGLALQSIAAASDCGAGAVKFQTHIAAAETTRDAPTPPFFAGEPRYEYFERTAFSTAEWIRIRDRCEALDVEFISSPFSVEAVELLEQVGVSRYKVPSGEVTNTLLIDAIADTGRPVVLSSGMSTWAELDRAVELLRGRQLVVLQCTSAYPCPYESVGLNVMDEMRHRYGTPVGFSDHTETNYAAFAAVCRGASIIEKHFALSRRMYGSDAAHSIEPDQMADLVQGVRALEVLLTRLVNKDDVERLEQMRSVFQKSVAARVDIDKGARLERDMLTVLKPGTGFEPRHLPELLGSTARRRIVAGTILSNDDIEPNDAGADHFRE